MTHSRSANRLVFINFGLLSQVFFGAITFLMGASAIADIPTQRVDVRGVQVPLDRTEVTPLKAVEAFPNANFKDPLFLTYAPDGSDRLFVIERDGRILVFENRIDAVPKTLVDLSSFVTLSGGEQGLLGLAFDPKYAANKYFYVYYSARSPRRSVIARFTDKGNILTSQKILLEIEQPFANHNGGAMAFGPDGYLYISVGDGGSAGDPHGNGQNLKTLLASLLRIDPHGGEPYGIPKDNPFVGRADAKDEIWAYGVRNAWRFSFDRKLGTLWVADVGQGSWEEINIIERKPNDRWNNLGWRIYEGRESYRNPSRQPLADFLAPVHVYPRSQGVSITGGYVYRGSKLTSLVGAYIYGDFGSGRVWALRLDEKGKVAKNVEISKISQLASFGEDRDGEIYAVSLRGKIYKFEPQLVSGTFPHKLSKTGLFNSLTPLAPKKGIIPYGVQTPLWSDGAKKDRWVYLPGKETIHYNEDQHWKYPIGTVLIKNFALGGKNLETRLLVHDRQGWAGYTYKWQKDQKDAQLIRERIVEDVEVGGSTQKWTYPSRADCMSCHTEAAGFVLGPQIQQLNGDYEYVPSKSANQLSVWSQIDFFNTRAIDPKKLPHFPNWETATPTSDSARAYLAVNCASCHQPGGPTPVTLDLRSDRSLAQMIIVNVDAASGRKRVAPGSKEKSELWLRLGIRGEGQMPPLGSHQVDKKALQTIGEWIDQL